jgi:hypothetical protein
MVFYDALVTIGANTHKVVSATVNRAKAGVDLSKMGDSATRQGRGAATGDSISFTFNQDFGSLHADLESIYSSANGTANVSVTPANTTVSASNPRYDLVDGVLLSYSPFSATWNDKSTVTVTFNTTGTQITANTGA